MSDRRACRAGGRVLAKGTSGQAYWSKVPLARGGVAVARWAKGTSGQAYWPEVPFAQGGAAG